MLPTSRLLLTTMVPFLALTMGVWEMQRSGTHQLNLEVHRTQLVQLVSRLEMQLAAEPRREMQFQFRRSGRSYDGPYAV